MDASNKSLLSNIIIPTLNRLLRALTRIWYILVKTQVRWALSFTIKKYQTENYQIFDQIFVIAIKYSIFDSFLFRSNRYQILHQPYFPPQKPHKIIDLTPSWYDNHQFGSRRKPCYARTNHVWSKYLAPQVEQTTADGQEWAEPYRF